MAFNVFYGKDIKHDFRSKLDFFYLTGVIGANAVTREDAVLSVHAGFLGQELSALWPAQGEPWRIQECAAGLFSHCFCAERLGVAQ